MPVSHENELSAMLSVWPSNDATAWRQLLVDHFGFAAGDVRLLLDGEATKAKVMAALKDLLAGAKSGDTLVFTNSSHGSYVADTDGDEEKYDEVLCPYDIEDNDIRDDELRELVAGIPAVDHRAWKRSSALVKMLPELRSRLRLLEERVAALSNHGKGEE